MPRSDQFFFSMNHGSCIKPAKSVLTPVNQVMGSVVITTLRFESGRGLGDEDVAAAGDEEDHQVRREREDVVQRQRGQHHLVRRAAGTGCHISRPCIVLATRLPCVSVAPLATPVVPPVYCRAATLSCVSPSA